MWFCPVPFWGFCPDNLETLPMDIDQLEDSALFKANSFPEMVDLSSDDDVHSPRGGQDGALDPTHVDASTTHESTADTELNAAPQDHSNPKCICVFGVSTKWWNLLTQMHPLDHPWQDGTFADPVPGADALTQHERIAYVLGRAKEKRLKASGKVVHRPVPAPLRSRGVEKPVEGPSPPCEASGSSGGMEAASAGACEKGEDVSSLLSLEPPLVLRREQLCANFRKGVRGGEDGGSEGENQDLEEAEPKTRPRKAAAKALAKASAKAKAKTDKPKPKSHKETKRGKTAAQKTASKAKGAEGDDGGNGKQKRGAPQTWARRYFPNVASDLAKFQAIKDTFEGQIRPHIRRQSSFQDRVKKSIPSSCIFLKPPHLFVLSSPCGGPMAFGFRTLSTSCARRHLCRLLRPMALTSSAARLSRAWWTDSWTVKMWDPILPFEHCFSTF